MSKHILTQERLKQLAHYDPDTGVFTWRVYRSSNARAGDVVGYVCATHGYRFMRIDNIKYHASHLVYLYVEGGMPKQQIDHINHKRDDDRWRNLREVSQSENLKNKSLQSNNRTGVTGVSWNKAMRKYHTYIVVSGKRVNLGFYCSLAEAAIVRGMAEIKHGFHCNHGRL